MVADGSWSRRTPQQEDSTRRALIDGRWRAVAWTLFIVLLFTLGIWRWFWEVQVIDYGDPAKTFFDKKEAAPGDRIGLWFTDARWLRVCKSELHTRVTCNMQDPQNASKTIEGRLDL